jgi:biotin carboxyl carrier protein
MSNNQDQHSQEQQKYQSEEEQQNGKAKKRFSTFVVDGTKYRTQITDKFKNRKKWDASNRGAVFSDFPGTVLKVDVQKGDNVEKGDRLYIYEAMKMKNRAYSPRDGKVKEVRISENEVIKKGQLLFVIE